ncbi:hypothetical protein RB195_020577 [Necator americanus]|uniref:Uncharacterized protein n=1 Tax=Necator americanus TaxID=51031 RepID=A0ABR1CJG9_NECAM
MVNLLNHYTEIAHETFVTQTSGINALSARNDTSLYFDGDKLEDSRAADKSPLSASISVIADESQLSEIGTLTCSNDNYRNFEVVEINPINDDHTPRSHKPQDSTENRFCLEDEDSPGRKTPTPFTHSQVDIYIDQDQVDETPPLEGSSTAVPSSSRVFGEDTYAHNVSVQREIDEVLDAFRRNDVMFMERKLESLKPTAQPIQRPAEEMFPNEQKDEFTFAEPDFEWVNEFERLPQKPIAHRRVEALKANALKGEISPPYRHIFSAASPFARPTSSSTPFSPTAQKFLYKEKGLLPMKPDYYRIAFDCDSEEYENEIESETLNRKSARNLAILNKKKHKRYKKIRKGRRYCRKSSS